jgi:hypothetical protein
MGRVSLANWVMEYGRGVGEQEPGVATPNPAILDHGTMVAFVARLQRHFKNACPQGRSDPVQGRLA